MRRAQLAASILALFAGATGWLSAGTLAVTGGDAQRVAALPSLIWLVAAMVAAVAAANLARLRTADAWPLAIGILIWLPFVPGSVPAAFLLWQGPIEGLVWTAVAAGLLYARPPGAPEALSDPARAPWLAAIGATAIALYAFSEARAIVPGGDEPHYLAATQSLIADRDLKVENNYARGDYLQYFDGRLRPHFLQRSAAGEIYSIHSPGVSLIVLPGFALAGYAGAVLTVIAIAGLTAALTWVVAWRVSRSAAAAWAGLIAVFATAPFAFHTFTIYPDGTGALPVMMAAWLLVRLLDDEIPRRGQLAVVGAMLGLLPWLHTRFALLSGVFGLVIIGLLATGGASRDSHRFREHAARMAAFLAAPAILAGAWFAYFWIIWGTPSPLAPYGRDTESSLSYIGRGLAGLTFDQQFGVLTPAPIYIMVLAGAWQLARQRARLGLALVMVTVPYAIAVSTYAMWWGGTSAPARFLGALLPLAAIPVATAWAGYPRLRIATLLLLLVSLGLVMPRLTEEGGRFIFTGRNTFDASIGWLSRHVDLALALPSVHRDGPAAATITAVPWLLAILVMCGESIVVAMRGLRRAAAWTIVAVSGAAMVVFAATLAWMLAGAQPVTRDRSAFAALAAQRGWHRVFVDVSHPASISREEWFRRMTLEVPAGEGTALLRAARVPPGEYEIAADGPVAVSVNRNDAPMESSAAPLRLRLPVGVSSLHVRAGGSMRVRPVHVETPVNRDGRSAIRAARYGRARVFFFDERAYPEPGGFWTRGEGHARIVIDADEAARRSGLPLAFTGGAAATTIGISVGEWSQSYSLTPGERREITLPPLAGERAWVVDLHSGPGFRPFEREPGNDDVRLLAAWFEIP